MDGRSHLVSSVHDYATLLPLRNLGGSVFFKQKTAYEIQGDWSSDVCSSDLISRPQDRVPLLPGCCLPTCGSWTILSHRGTQWLCRKLIPLRLRFAMPWFPLFTAICRH